jgi:DNA-binding XRE family transcriptional regulator
VGDRPLQHVSENIRRLAGMFLVEQQRVAQEADIARQSMYAIYYGLSRPGAETAFRIARAFGITVDDLYATPPDCLAAALPHLYDAPITRPRDDPRGEDSAASKVTPIKKPPK